MRAAPTAALLVAFLTAAMLPSPGRADTSATPLADGFEGDDFAPGGGLFYKHNHEQSAGTVVFQSQVVRSGRQSLDLSVRPLCPPESELCSERAEIWEKPDVLVPYGRQTWYALSMQLAQPVSTERHRYVMMQWKREIDPGAMGDYSPLLALRLMEGRIAVTVDTDTGTFAPIGTSERPTGCKPGEAMASPPDEYNQFRTLVAIEPGVMGPEEAGFTGCTPDIRVTPRGALPAAGSGWVDYVFSVKPGPTGDGRIDVVANGKWIVTVEGKIGHEGPQLGEHMYFKFGPYRGGDGNVWRIYYDDFRRGPACTDVADAAICAKIAD
ncbi:polysaccharide lyase [Ancylobacter sp. Lp-2]|uniref:polysaccharide lyase n=1 Tax=Ancylobacter sp. Lp-2 TaxID=2881339 RepID=UPI001E30543E|nr:polysaccharide lyase [Ancylobacter sp. Lp-2]MCB4768291.1 polysaccharide lyase [Ancylobacter sp. Lp-2]